MARERIHYALLLMVACAAILAGCTETLQTPEPKGENPEPRNWTIAMTAEGFMPEVLSMKQGDLVTLTTRENMIIDTVNTTWVPASDLKVLVHRPLQFEAPAPGTYRIYCAAGCPPGVDQYLTLIVE